MSEIEDSDIFPRSFEAVSEQEYGENWAAENTNPEPTLHKGFAR
jgi:hypothetical protein